MSSTRSNGLSSDLFRRFKLSISIRNAKWQHINLISSNLPGSNVLTQRVDYKLPGSSRVSANVAEVALTSGINLVGDVKNAAIGVEPLGNISNSSLSRVNICVNPDAAKAIPNAPPTKI